MHKHRLTKLWRVSHLLGGSFHAHQMMTTPMCIRLSVQPFFFCFFLSVMKICLFNFSPPRIDMPQCPSLWRSSLWPKQRRASLCDQENLRFHIWGFACHCIKKVSYLSFWNFPRTCFPIFLCLLNSQSSCEGFFQRTAAKFNFHFIYTTSPTFFASPTSSTATSFTPHT